MASAYLTTQDRALRWIVLLSPPMATIKAGAKARHGFVRASRLFLIIIDFVLFAFATLEDRLDAIVEGLDVFRMRFFEPLLALGCLFRANQPKFWMEDQLVH